MEQPTGWVTKKVKKRRERDEVTKEEVEDQIESDPGTSPPSKKSKVNPDAEDAVETKTNKVLFLTNVSDLKEDQGELFEVRLPGSDADPVPVALFLHHNSVYAFHAVCPHAGGPLYSGTIEDIEELGTKRCFLICPWHSYRFCAQTGKCYQVEEEEDGTKKLKQEEKEQVQIYPVFLKDDGGVYAEIEFKEITLF